MTVIAWIVQAGWQACVDAAIRHAAPDSDIVLLLVADFDAAHLAHGADPGLLGRAHPQDDPGARVQDLASAGEHKLLGDPAARLGSRCRTLERTGRIETEVITAAQGAELLVLARDSDASHRSSRSISHASRYVIDHAPCAVLLVWPGPPP